MSNKHNGGSAFPSTEANYHNENMRSDGMSLRDYFAAKVSDSDVDEIISNYLLEASLDNSMIPFPPSRQQARYMHADAMLAERAK